MTTVAEPATTAKTSGDQAPTPEPAPDKPKTSEREYVIFEQRSNGWFEIKRVTASDVEGAINTLGKELKANTKYTAVAERYWKPATPKVETHTTISLVFD